MKGHIKQIKGEVETTLCGKTGDVYTTRLYGTLCGECCSIADDILKGYIKTIVDKSGS